MELIKIGKIVNTHGIKGELRILSKFPYKEKIFIKNMKLYIDKKDIETINTYRKHKNFDIVMAVFDITQKVVSDSSGIIAGNTRVNDIGLSMLEASLMQMDVGQIGRAHV